MMKRIIAQIAAGILLCTAVGCAPTLGDAYKRVEAVPSAKALVYIYRPSGMGGAVYYDVKANGKVVTTLYSGSYYPYVTDPGEIEFSAKTEASDEVTIDAKANQTYFLRGSVGLGFFVGHPHLTVVPAEEAEKEIAPGTDSSVTLPHRGYEPLSVLSPISGLRCAAPQRL
jgi:hypothetical protein